MWVKAGPGRKPGIPDAEIAELRRRHIERGITLEVLSRQTGLSRSMLGKIMTGQRRARAGGPIRPASTPGPTMDPHIRASVKAEILRGRKQYAIARKYGVSKGYVSKVARQMKRAE